MHSYSTEKSIITNLTTISEGNALIMRKGRTSLLSSKVMLFALLKLEDRRLRRYDFKELQYYQQLKLSSTVDYSKGLVAEMDVADLKKLLNKECSGSFTASLKRLFSIDPREEKSLRHAWAIMLPNKNTGVLGYAEVVTACHYDVSAGKLFIKFSDEDFIKNQIWQIKNEYTELPFLHMMHIKSSYAYRLYEILSSEISKTDDLLRTQGEHHLPNEYSFRFSLGELLLMLGVIDITKDDEGKKLVATKNPDYNTISADVNTRQLENMGNYRNFRRYALDVAVAEINATTSSAFTFSYDVERVSESSKKISHVIFYVKKKSALFVNTTSKEQTNNHQDFIVDIARELSNFRLSYDDLCKIAELSNYDIGIIVAARALYQSLNLTDPFVEWFEKLRS